jgi:hypothetical protein
LFHLHCVPFDNLLHLAEKLQPKALVICGQLRDDGIGGRVSCSQSGTLQTLNPTCDQLLLPLTPPSWALGAYLCAE